jgi:apolipoprotein N-acyltransferase
MGMALIGAWFGFANPLLHFPLAILLLPAALILTTLRATGLCPRLQKGLSDRAARLCRQPLLAGHSGP